MNTHKNNWEEENGILPLKERANIYVCAAGFAKGGKNLPFYHSQASKSSYSRQNRESRIATFSARSLVNMFSQNMGNAVVHRKELPRAACEMARARFSRERVC